MMDWEMRYRNEGPIWTFEPSNTADNAARWFRDNDKQSVYIIGVGYGRNVAPFLKRQLVVSGIDLSESACRLGKQHFPSVAFNVGGYEQAVIARQEAIYCSDVIHFLPKAMQMVFIQKMYEDLEFGGTAYVTVLSNVAQFPEEEKQGQTFFTERELSELCSHAAFQIESITPHTDMFYYPNGKTRHYPLLCAKLRK